MAQPVEAVRPAGASAAVRNLTVEGLHTYYIVSGGANILVHNSSCSTARFEVNSDGVVKDRTVSDVKLNKQIGDARTNELARELEGRTEVNMRTPTHTRRQDVVYGGGRKAAGSKVGRTGNGSRIRQEYSGDAWFLRTGGLTSHTWFFYRSPLTGRIGPTGSLAWQLLQRGITIRIRY